MIGMYNLLDSQQNSCWRTSLLDAGMVSPSFATLTAIPSDSVTTIASCCPSHWAPIAKHRQEATVSHHGTSDLASQDAFVHDYSATMMVLGHVRSANKAPLVAYQRYLGIRIYRKAMLFRSYH